MDLSGLFPWFVVIGGLLLAVYTLSIIKNEGKSFKEECYFVSICGLTFPIPDWWDMKKIDDQTLQFSRTDTRYAWRAKYQYMIHSDKTPLLTLLEQYQDKTKIHFDDDVIIETKSEHLIKDKVLAQKFTEVIRVEGKGTKDIIDRVYVDLYLLRFKEETNYFFFESVSSVLNGFVEGPFFEESIFEMSEETKLALDDDQELNED